MKNNWNIKDILLLTYFKNFKLSQIFKIIDEFENINSFFESDFFNNLFSNITKQQIKDYEEQVNNQFELAEKNNTKVISYFDDNYPELLKNTSSPPIILYIRGNYHKNLTNISVVGTRKPTYYGKISTENFVESFVKNNIAIVSGLAYGIDTISHLSAIKYNGITYAILPSSIDTISPANSKKNAEKIIDNGGALISEYKFGTQANLASFPQRNRIIAGISIATVVVECGLKSGALITAKISNSESREVFAVPGNINSEKSKGTNKLIKDNLAIIATSPEDVLNELGLLIYQNNDQKFDILDDIDENKIYQVLNSEPIHIDSILELTDLDLATISSKLLFLEMKGLIKQLPGKLYIKV